MLKRTKKVKGVILQSVLSMAKVEAKEIIIAFGDFRRVEWGDAAKNYLNISVTLRTFSLTVDIGDCFQKKEGFGHLAIERHATYTFSWPRWTEGIHVN